MAKQTVETSTPNSGEGTELRSAFIMLNQNFDEVYGNNFVTELMLSDNIVGADELKDGGVGTTQIADDAVTADKIANAVNTLISNNTAKVTNATHTGDVTGATGLTIASSAVTTAKINNDAVTHDKLSARFTAEVAISTRTGTVNYDCATASSFKLSGDLTGAYTINLTNYKKGQVITIYPLKAQTIKLTAGTGTEVFNKLSAVDYDNTVSSILQIECVDDQAADPVFFYSVATFALTTVGSTI
jgi:hypothetical protein